MIMGIASLIFVPMLAIAMVHFIWAFGFNWPVKDEKALARTVAGFKGIEKMPPRLLSAAVAIGVLFAGVWVLAMADPQPSFILSFGGAIIALGFFARGVIGYSKKWHEITPEQPFRKLDKKIYSPLCLFIGVGIFVLLLWRVF